MQTPQLHQVVLVGEESSRRPRILQRSIIVLFCVMEILESEFAEIRVRCMAAYIHLLVED